VILSGALDDGASGALAVKLRGGRILAQSPGEAMYPSMPLSVIDSVGADHVGTIAELATHLVRLTHEQVPDAAPARPQLTENEAEDDDMAADPEVAPTGPASSFSCPECHGALWELRDGQLARFRCRVGHAFAPDSLIAYQAAHVEEAMWTAYRALEETSALAARLAARARDGGLEDLAKRYEAKGEDALARAKVIRTALELSSPPAAGDDAAPAGAT
jgi:two-component system chemotaxis response regulator CheB